MPMMERELKLTAPDAGTLDAILASASIRSVCASDPDADAETFNAIYYDSADQVLQKARCGLRARMEGEHLRAAMKMPGRIVDGLSERVEYEADLTDWPKAFSDFPEGDLRVALAERVDLATPMVERVRVSMQRRIRHLVIGKTEIELVADRGEISGLKGEQELYEIELELKSGEVEPMLELGAQLKQQFPLAYSTVTKLGIGLSLC